MCPLSASAHIDASTAARSPRARAPDVHAARPGTARFEARGSCGMAGDGARAARERPHELRQIAVKQRAARVVQVHDHLKHTQPRWPGDCHPKRRCYEEPCSAAHRCAYACVGAPCSTETDTPAFRAPFLPPVCARVYRAVIATRVNNGTPQPPGCTGYVRRTMDASASSAGGQLTSLRHRVQWPVLVEQERQRPVGLHQRALW